MILFFIFSFLFSQPQLADGVLAVVGNQVVLFSEVKDEVDLRAKEKKIPLSSSLYVDLFQKVLNKNIDNKVILNFAKQDSSLIVSYDEIKKILDERVAFYVQQFGSVFEFERAVGMTVGEMKEKNRKVIEEEILIEKYRMKNFRNTKITKHDVFAFYDEYKDSLPPTPPLGSFSLLQKKIEPSLKNKTLFYEKTNSLIDSLNLGLLDFTEVALKRSIDPSVKNNNGVLVSMRGDLVPEYEKTAYSLKEGEIGSLTKSPFGYHIIKLLNKKGEKIKTQHILFSLPFEEDDVSFAFSYLDSIKTATKNDPGVFDSLAQSINYGFSGVYEKEVFDLFPVFVENFVSSGENYSFSDIIKEKDTFNLIYKYSFLAPEEKNITNSWFELETLALNKKRFDDFDLWIKEKKENLYIFVSDF